MRRIYGWILVFLLLFCGCTHDNSVVTSESTAPSQTVKVQLPEITQPAAEATAEPTTVPLETVPVEMLAGGSVAAYSLDLFNGNGIRFMGEDILVFSSNGTMLTLFSADDLTLKAQTRLESSVFLHEGSYAVSDSQFVYCCMDQKVCIFLNHLLEETHRVKVPASAREAVVISRDMTMAYYSDGQGIAQLDLDTGESSYILQSERYIRLKDMLFDDSVLFSRYETAENGEIICNMDFISVVDGTLLGHDTSLYQITTWDDNYMLYRTQNGYAEYLWGVFGEEPLAFEASARHTDITPIPELNGVVSSITHTETLPLELYELSTGKRTAAVQLELGNSQMIWPPIADPTLQYIWFMGTNDVNGEVNLYRWDYGACPTGDDTVYTGPRYTQETPDTEGLLQSEERIKAMEEKYGVEIFVNTEPQPPEGYGFEYVYQTSVIEEALDSLEVELSRYPEGFLEDLGSYSDAGRIQVGLVAEIETYSEDYTMGITYRQNGNDCISVMSGMVTGRLINQEIGMLLNKYILQSSNCLDAWKELNPEGFRYFDELGEGETRDNTAYVGGADSVFIDSTGKTSAAMERAMIMDYAMLKDANVFQSKTLQAKLRLWCQAIREVFELEGNQGALAWEQYLNEPLD